MNKNDEIDIIKFDDNKKSNIQNRLRSKVAWMAIVSMLLPILGHLGVYEKLGITEDYAKTIIDAIFVILVSFGVFNNPSDSTKF